MTQYYISTTARVISVVVVGVLSVLVAFQAHANEPVACTADAKACPDGSFVGRTGSDCTFAACPGDVTDTETPAETVKPATPVRQVIQSNVEERNAYRTRVQQERRDVMEAQQTDRVELREAGAPLQEVRELRIEQRQEMRTVLSEQHQEKVTLRTEAREERKGALEERRAEIRARIDEHQNERAARIEEHTARLEAAMQKRLSTFVDRMVTRMNATLDHLGEIAERIGSRISKLEDRGAEVGDAEEALDDAYAQITVARGDVAAFLVIAEDVLSSEDPKEGMTEMREAAALAKESIKGVHQALRDAVEVVKALSEPVSSNDDTLEGEEPNDDNE